jgi:hypothetical protein
MPTLLYLFVCESSGGVCAEGDIQLYCVMFTVYLLVLSYPR